LGLAQRQNSADKKTVTKMAVILPFEVDTYRQAGFSVDYVGHPLLDQVKINSSRELARKEFSLHEKNTIIGLLPGSRTSEVVKLLPEMLRAAEIIAKKILEAQFVLPLADTLDQKAIAGIISGFAVNVKVIGGRTHKVISCCDLAIVASGTATLETALLGVPMIIVYKISSLSYFIGKLAIRVKNIGLVNIIAGKTIVPELIQAQASGTRIAAEALTILTNEPKREEITRELAEIRAKLGNPGAALRAAKLACDMI
jgi:lipid-A-disaccharide synthase